MKSPRFLLFLLGMLLLTSNSVRAEGGDVLERMVQLPRMRGTIYALLGKLSEQSSYLFIYDSKVINNDSIVKVRKQSCTMRQAIYEITGNQNLELKVLGNHILIAQMTEATPARDRIRESPRSTYSTVTGKLLDKETGEPIANASVLGE